MLRLSDTHSRARVELTPDAPVGMYVCGPTVYARAHVGNARPFVVFSWIKRWLELQGHTVRFVHNITDVNDKIYDAAPGHSAELAERASAWYIEDIERFGLGLPDVMPKVTDSMPQIIELIRSLLASGHAYAADGDVYFDVGSFPSYGALSGRSGVEAEDAEPSPVKRDPRDFALWKATKPGEDTSWETEWGVGRPGWHIECSAMALEHLGSSFDLHGGGLDLVFPHHENERAQSMAAGHDFARVWAHNGMLEFAGEKMSKSVGNIATISEALDEWGPEVLLLVFANARWSSPMEYSPTTLNAAAARLDTIVELAGSVPPTEADPAEWRRAVEALDDDFNTPMALSLVHEWLGKGYRTLARQLLDVFGLTRLVDGLSPPDHVRDLLAERGRAREEKDYGRADDLRSAIAAEGWSVGDTPAGATLVPTHVAFRRAAVHT